jgi:hypothetical protein
MRSVQAYKKLPQTENLTVCCHKKFEYLNLLKIKHVIIVFYSKFQYLFTELTQEIPLALHQTFGIYFINYIPLKNPIT